MNRPVTAPTPVDYPCSDGQPMAESDFQLEPLVYAITALRTHFHHRKKVYVAGDMFLYHEEDDPRCPERTSAAQIGKRKYFSANRSASNRTMHSSRARADWRSRTRRSPASRSRLANHSSSERANKPFSPCRINSA